MDSAVITIIILLITICAYMISSIPISATSILSVSLLTAFGIISVQEAFSGFASTTTFLLIGFMIIGKSMFSTGLADDIGRMLYKVVHVKERIFTLILMLTAAAMSIFLSPTLVVALFMPIIDSICVQTNGKFQRKHLYFPLGICSVYGSLSTVSGAATVVALSYLSGMGYEMPGIFSMVPIKLPALIVSMTVIFFIGDRLGQTTDFEETPIEGMHTQETEGQPKSKKTIVGIVLIAVVAGMVIGLNLGYCAMFGAAVLIITGCISEKEAFSGVTWPTVILVACTTGLSTAVQSSGAGKIISSVVIELFGNLSQSPYGICMAIFIAVNVLSSFMSDSGTAAIVSPVALAVVAEMGYDPLPFVMAIAVGSLSAIGTPISTAPMTMLQCVGYRFKDYIKYPGVISLIYVAVAAIMFKIVFF